MKFRVLGEIFVILIYRGKLAIRCESSGLINAGIIEKLGMRGATFVKFARVFIVVRCKEVISANRDLIPRRGKLALASVHGEISQTSDTSRT